MLALSLVPDLGCKAGWDRTAGLGVLSLPYYKRKVSMVIVEYDDGITYAALQGSACGVVLGEDKQKV